MTVQRWPDIESLIPHRAPMRLLDRVLEIDEESIVTLAVVPDGGPFAAPQADLPGYVVIEMMAQSVSAWDGWQRCQQGGGPEVGYLLGTRRFRCDRPTLRAGEPLRIVASMVFSDGEMAAFDCEARCGETEPFAAATLNVFCGRLIPEPER